MSELRDATVKVMTERLRPLVARYRASTSPSFIAGQLAMRERGPGDYEELAANAATDQLHFRAARLEIAAILELTGKIPSALQPLAVRILRGESQPSHHGRHAELDDYRARVVVDVVGIAVSAGFTAFRNDASDHENSACDMAAEAFSIVGLSPTTYAGIKKIYLSGRGAAISE